MMTPGLFICVRCGTPAMATRCDRCGIALRVRDFTITEVLAENEHSRVYIARGSDGQPVALKELLYATVPSARELEAFNREGAILEQLRHSNVPRVVARFADGEGALMRLYLAQQFVQGESLAARLARGPLSEAETLGVAREVLTILRFLHSRQPRVIHRDIKPANIIRDVTGKLWLVDFGAARLLERQETQQGTVVGTFGYMPPEQFTGALDETSDLYALGATLLHLVSGREPAAFLQPNMRIEIDAFVPVTDNTHRILAKLLAPANQRFRTASEVLAAIENPTVTPTPKRGPSFARVALLILACGAVGFGSFRLTRSMQRFAPSVVPRVDVQIADNEGAEKPPEGEEIVIDSDEDIHLKEDHPLRRSGSRELKWKDLHIFSLQGDMVMPGPVTIRSIHGCTRYQNMHLTSAGLFRTLEWKEYPATLKVVAYMSITIMGTTPIDEAASCSNAVEFTWVHEDSEQEATISGTEKSVTMSWTGDATGPFYRLAMKVPGLFRQTLEIDRINKKLTALESKSAGTTP